MIRRVLEDNHHKLDALGNMFNCMLVHNTPVNTGGGTIEADKLI